MLKKTLKKQDLPHFVGPLFDFRSIWGPQGEPKIDDLGRDFLVVIPPGTNLEAFLVPKCILGDFGSAFLPFWLLLGAAQPFWTDFP